ncbi:uncharacterized protein LOC142341607 [Convolutriloba macropyga]|uniref:uncharacterized protein LOC142341607 n=1 Tax=Convolutriloba macropyga TaxID=536237 RepID=UPI003F5246C5
MSERRSNRQSVNNSSIRMSTIPSENGRMSTHSSGNNTRVSSVNNPNNIDWKISDGIDVAAQNWITAGNPQSPVTFNDLELYGNGNASHFDNNPITVHNKQLELIENYRRLKTNVRCVNSCTIFFLVIAFLLIGVVAAASLLSLRKIDLVQSQSRNQKDERSQWKQSLENNYAQLKQKIPEINKTIVQHQQQLQDVQQQQHDASTKISQLVENIKITNSSLSSKITSLDEIKRDVDDIRTKINNTPNINESIMNQIEETNKKVDEKDNDLQEQLNKLEAQIKDLLNKITVLEQNP